MLRVQLPIGADSPSSVPEARTGLVTGTFFALAKLATQAELLSHAKVEWTACSKYDVQLHFHGRDGACMSPCAMRTCTYTAIPAHAAVLVWLGMAFREPKEYAMAPMSSQLKAACSGQVQEWRQAGRLGAFSYRRAHDGVNMSDAEMRMDA
eukprot:1153954-Pelagomonas_calceolata.AAC.3